MIIDSSALVAILAKEQESEALLRAVVDAPAAAVTAPTLLETCIALRRFGPTIVAEVHRFIAEASVRVVPFEAEHVQAAEEAHRKFGRGSGHPARLNFGDCISYAVAIVAREPLLFKGDDFTHTDVIPAL